MGARYLLDLAEVCRYAGYAVVEVDDWQYRARGSGGYDPGYPNHLIVHHTASGAASDPWGDVNYCAYGHTDAPVGNLYLSRDGTVYVMAGGAANTNGSGHDPCGLVPDDGMNSRSIAIEAANEGTGEPWSEDQQDSYRRLCASLCTAYGIGVAQLHSHFEWAPGRKIDPAGQSAYATGSAMWDMDAYRHDVDDLTDPPAQEDDMTNEQARQLDELHAAITAPIYPDYFTDPNGKPINVPWATGYTWTTVQDILARLERLEAEQ